MRGRRPAGAGGRVLLALLALACGDVQSVPTPEPLLMAGKSSLYQRVLASPGTRLFKEPGSSADPGQPVTPFSTFYVYGRREAAGQEWLEIGPDSHGSVAGFAPTRQLIPWNQALTVTFKDPASGERVLLFRDRDSLKRLIDQNDLESYERYYDEAIRGDPSADSPIVAIQPGTRIDIEKDFYLVPIKHHEDLYLQDRPARLLEVASVPLEAGGQAEGAAARPFRTGIVFVMDATQSMRPYIERTRAVTRRVFDAIAEAGLRDQVSFGLTAFRDHLAESTDQGFVSRNFATLDTGTDARRFFEQVAALRASDVTNPGFVEDTYAGIKDAIEGNPWSDFDARYIVLVADASAREAGDPLSSTGLDLAGIRQLARDRGIALWVMHLKTPMGVMDHQRAKQQYRALSEYPGIGELYYGVGMGSAEEFERVLHTLASQIAAQVQIAAKAGSSLPPAGQGDEALISLQQRIEKLGHALRMKYLKAKGGDKPPQVFDAWLVDRDPRNPEETTIEVRVLLTRDQLSDLRNALAQVLELAEEGVLSPRNFVAELKAMAARLSRNQATPAGAPGGSTLAELGLIGEYVEDLPYHSEVLGLSLDDWEAWPAERQLDFVHRLESKIQYYHALHDHTDLWVSLSGGPITGESVFPVLLELLP
jgi:serine/threonine-protein kinase PpkA